MRRAAGDDFKSDVSASDKEGTRKNMLRPEVLDAQRHPLITVQSVRVAGALGSPQITARITIRDAARDVEVPTRIQLDGERLLATGEFDLKQTDFGITPFSLSLGALQVQDRLHIKFSITASRRTRT
jgi:polyisoprenoid-binding protein YceI